MNRVLALISLVLLTGVALAGCGGKTKTVTVTSTVTVTATPSSSPSDASDGSSDSSSDSTADSSSATASAVSADSGPDACSLLTQAQANAVASTPLQKGTGAGQTSSGGFSMCQWIGQDGGPTAELEVYVGDGAKQQLHIDRDNLGHQMTSVPGVADQCLQEDGYIFIEKNNLWVSIHLVRLNDAAENVKPMQTGAKLVAAKLP